MKKVCEFSLLMVAVVMLLASCFSLPSGPVYYWDDTTPNGEYLFNGTYSPEELAILLAMEMENRHSMLWDFFYDIGNMADGTFVSSLTNFGYSMKEANTIEVQTGVSRLNFKYYQYIEDGWVHFRTCSFNERAYLIYQFLDDFLFGANLARPYGSAKKTQIRFRFKRPDEGNTSYSWHLSAV